MFQKNKNQEEFEMVGRYWDELRKKRVPLLTLDPRWHALFPDHLKSKKMIRLEKTLNKLIQKQGQTNNDLKDYEKTKKVLMENVLNNMTDGQQEDSILRGRKQEKNQKLLDDLHQKIQDAEEIIDKIPLEIKETNQALLIESMRICYETLMENTAEIEAEEAWISNVRAELTEHVLHKQEMEIRNSDTYRFMHDLLGADIVEIFDREHKVWKGEIGMEHKVDDLFDK